MAGVLFCLALAAGAQSTPQPRFAVPGFQVVGPNPLSPVETERVLQPFVRTDADLDTLQQAVVALEQAFRTRGYRLHFVQLPAQDLGERVVLEVVAVTLNSVQVAGNHLRGDSSIRRALPALQEGRTPDLGHVAVQTAMANGNPHRQLTVELREAQEPGRMDAVVQVHEKKPWSVGAALSNTGSAVSGRDRLTLTGSHSNVLDRDHQVVAAYTTSVERGRDVKQLGVGYTVPLYAQRAVAALGYTRSDVVGRFGEFTSTGAGRGLQLSYTLHQPPRGELRSRWIVALEDRLYRANDVNGVPVGTPRRSRPLSVGYAFQREAAGREWAAQAELVGNTGMGRHGDVDAYRTEYPDIRTARWLALRASGNWLERLPRDLILSLRTNLQYTGDALIAGEQFGLGGQGSVRGTQTDRPVAGDRGLSASVELLTPSGVEGLQALLFLDAGWIGNIASDQVQRIGVDRLVGAGFGLRYAVGPLHAAGEYGRLLVGSRWSAAANPAAPRRGEDRLYLNVGVRF